MKESTPAIKSNPIHINMKIAVLLNSGILKEADAASINIKEDCIYR